MCDIINTILDLEDVMSNLQTDINSFKYKVSIVCSVYNVESYIREAIDSIIAQSIGFRENVQIVMVDDGSTDSSGAICDEYAAEYPDNIVVLHKENEGLSRARKDGIPLTVGKYVTFFDPDDILSSETLENVVRFFDKHYDRTDVVSVPIYMFGGYEGAHPLNDKFEEGTRVINLAEEWQVAQMSLATAYIKREVINLIDADEQLVTSEDAKELVKILTEKMTLGVVSEAKYLYRRRGNSQVGKSRSKPAWYLTYLEHYTEWAIDYCREKLGYVPNFIYYTLMYDLQWRFMPARIENDEISEEQKREYVTKLFSLVNGFPSEVIFCQRLLPVYHKLYLAYRSHGATPPEVIKGEDGVHYCFAYNGESLHPIDGELCRIHFIRLSEKNLTVEGTFTRPAVGIDFSALYASVGGERVPIRWTGYDESTLSAGVEICTSSGFELKLPLSELTSPTTLSFEIDIAGTVIPLGAPCYEKFAPLTGECEYSYYAKGGYMLTPSAEGMVIAPATRKEIKRRDRLFTRALLRGEGKASKKAFVARILYKTAKRIYPKNIWLVMDKADRADDNGEAFFTYLCKNKDKLDCTPIFAISKSSVDYKRLKRIGHVVPYMSWRHKILHLIAKHTVSAYSHDEISRPFLENTKFYANLMQDNQVIFLQHGIIKDDLSKSLNRRHKNFSMFVTSTVQERDSVLRCNYGYNEDEVVLTGLPRYDALYNAPEKKITIMPTWLRKLFGSYDAASSTWSLLDGFEESEYYLFYNSLINSDRLLSAAEKYGYTIQFMPHPVFFPYMDRFTTDGRAVILDPATRYRDVFATSSLITTDYSSVAFDFAYLRKPLFYTQFEENHYETGYFDYERDGFGEVEKTLEATVDRMIEYMQNDCRLKDEYRARIDSFFAFADKNNCRRVYEKILEVEKLKDDRR